MLKYESTIVRKDPAFFRIEIAETFFNFANPVIDELLEGLGLQVDDELAVLLGAPAKAAPELPADARPSKAPAAR